MTRRTVLDPFWLLGQSGRYGYFWLHIWVVCDYEPVQCQYPETLPKVQAIHGATSGSPNSEVIKALKPRFLFFFFVRRSLLYHIHSC